MRAVILAGGRGSRLRPLTDTRPKPLVPFVGEPFAAGLLRRLAAAGCDRVDLLVGADPKPFGALAAVADEVAVAVRAVPEEVALDTAGAARRLLRGTGGGPVLVCNGDILTDLDLAGLVAAHRRAGATATLALTRVADPSSFGVVVCDDDGRVVRFVEKPPAGTVDADTVNAGTYVLSAEAFDAFPGDGPLSFEREVFPGLLAAGAPVIGVPSAAYWADLGTPARYLAATAAVLDGRCRWPLPTALARVGPALVHRDAEVGGARLGPGTVVGAGCVVAAGAHLDAAVLLDRVRVGRDATVRAAILGEGARVGEAASVGPGAVVADGASVPAGSRT